MSLTFLTCFWTCFLHFLHFLHFFFFNFNFNFNFNFFFNFFNFFFLTCFNLQLLLVQQQAAQERRRAAAAQEDRKGRARGPSSKLHPGDDVSVQRINASAFRCVSTVLIA